MMKYTDFDNNSNNEEFDFDNYELDSYLSHRLSNSENIDNKKNSNGALC